MRRFRLALAFGAFLVAAAADAWLLETRPGEFWWSRVYGFFSLFGFAGSLAIIAVAKFVIGPWLRRAETYYERRSPQ